NQATDRAHRLGQDKPVFVYKLVTEQTVEERILTMQERKRALAAGVYQESEGEQEPRLSGHDLQELFAPFGER
uniref:DEAD/DEAH box helicase n=1 Tax=uncultured Lamprocystis sp. TaxID=543132 RepID=UPI0025CCD84D